MNDDLIEDLREHLSRGDRIAYYDALQQDGSFYGRLASGVVLHDFPSGRAANNFFALQSVSENRRSASTNSPRSAWN